MVAPRSCDQGNQVARITTRIPDYRLETRLPTVYENEEADLRLWELRVKAALRWKDIAEASADKDVDKKTCERALAVIVSVLGDKLLSAIQDCKTAIEAWEKLQSGYAGRSMINRLTALKNLHSIKLKCNVQIGDHMAHTESRSSRLDAMRFEIEEQIKVAVLVSFLCKRQECAHTVASVHIIQNKMAKWLYLINIVIEDNKRLKNRRMIISNQGEAGELEAEVAKPRMMQGRQRNRRLKIQRCCNCNRIRHYTRECRSRNNHFSQ